MLLPGETGRARRDSNPQPSDPVDSVTRTHYLPIPALTCWNATHWCAIHGSIERPRAAKMRPAQPSHLTSSIAARPSRPS